MGTMIWWTCLIIGVLLLFSQLSLVVLTSGPTEAPMYADEPTTLFVWDGTSASKIGGAFLASGTAALFFERWGEVAATIAAVAAMPGGVTIAHRILKVIRWWTKPLAECQVLDAANSEPLDPMADSERGFCADPTIREKVK